MTWDSTYNISTNIWILKAYAFEKCSRRRKSFDIFSLWFLLHKVNFNLIECSQLIISWFWKPALSFPGLFFMIYSFALVWEPSSKNLDFLTLSLWSKMLKKKLSLRESFWDFFNQIWSPLHSVKKIKRLDLSFWGN